jgi:hypothetical protein
MINGAKEYTNDATLSPLDSDEGKYLTHSLPLFLSHPKK